MKDEVLCANGKTYKKYVPVEFGQDKVVLKDGRVKITSNIKSINVTNYEDMVMIEGEWFTEIQKKGGNYAR